MTSPPEKQPVAISPTGQLLTIIFVLACGLGAGLGLYTFRYAQGLSYFSADPKACVNCHIMRPQYDSWQKASHHTSATCVDCHLPTALIPKYLAKASNGWHHSKGFTLQNFEEPIRIKPGNSAILQNNCVRCHADTVHAITSTGHPRKAFGNTNTQDDLTCVHCHANVGHGERASIGAGLKPFEIPDPTTSTKHGEHP